MKILMMGDSTMKKNNYYSYPQFGWGQGIELFVKDGILVYNYAEMRPTGITTLVEILVSICLVFIYAYTSAWMLTMF